MDATLGRERKGFDIRRTSRGVTLGAGEMPFPRFKNIVKETISLSLSVFGSLTAPDLAPPPSILSIFLGARSRSISRPSCCFRRPPTPRDPDFRAAFPRSRVVSRLPGAPPNPRRTPAEPPAPKNSKNPRRVGS
jgi:hypothetical protein